MSRTIALQDAVGHHPIGDTLLTSGLIGTIVSGSSLSNAVGAVSVACAVLGGIIRFLTFLGERDHRRRQNELLDAQIAATERGKGAVAP